jgi:hypothetical protein
MQICVNMCICNSQILIYTYLYDHDTKPKLATKLQLFVSVDKASQDRCPRRIFTEGCGLPWMLYIICVRF